MNPAARTCPACHQPLPADAPQGLCPQCLAKSALGSQPGAEETVASGSKPGGSGPAAIQTEIARLFPQLEILEPLGQGGMGMVYKARQLQLDRLVALKVMRADLSRDPAFAERFAREARALAKLNHPNIVSVFDFGQSGGHCWILMEFVDGTNLRELLRTKTLLPREALGIVPKVCDALQYAHDEDIVHRDIKPENILLDKKGRVKIADFGLAKLVGKDASEFSLTATGMTLGTPRYMAPEQFDKPQEVDHRADIYSLGVVLYEMLTGEVPMGRFSLPSATIGVDVRLDEIVLRTLEKEPSRRYQHVSEVKTQVEHVADTTATKAPPTPTVVTPAASSPDDENAEDVAEQSVFAAWGGRIIALVAVLLAFFNPWGAKGWYYFAAGCAVFGVLSAFGIGRRRISEKNGEPTEPTGYLHALLAESLMGKAAISLAVLAMLAHKLQWQFLVVNNQTLTPANSLILACQQSLLLLGLAIGAALFAPAPALPPAGRKFIRSLAALGALGALCFQVNFLLSLGEWEPGGYGMVQRMTRSYPQAGLYVTAVITALALLFFVAGIVEGRDDSRATNAEPSPQQRFLRSILWLAFFTGVLMFCWFDVRRSALRPEDGGVATTVLVGAMQPWLTVGSSLRVGGYAISPNFLTVSGLAGIGALLALITLICFRPTKPAPVSESSSEPRLSRLALWGAIWAAVGLLAVIPLVIIYFTHKTPSGVVRPSDAVLILAVISGFISLSSMFGATIMGSLAIAQIKRSNGKLYGLRLAMTDALLYPLLALDIAILAFVVLSGFVVLGAKMGFHSTASQEPLLRGFEAALTLFIGLPLAAWIDVWIVRRAWRKIAGPTAAPKAAGLTSENVRAKLRFAGIGLLIVGIINAFAGMIWIGSNVSALTGLWQHDSPWGWQFAQTLISLGSIVIVYYQVGVGIWLMNPDDDGDPTFVLVMTSLCPPGCVLGLPVAIYAFMQLTKPEGKALLTALRAKPVPQVPTSAKASQPPSQPDFRQQDAREILSMVMTILSGLSLLGVIAGVTGLARVLFPALRTDMQLGPAESLGQDAWEFGGILVLSLMASFLLPKARRQGRDRLARINAANLIIVGALLIFACGRHWFGESVPYWFGGIYTLVALVCWIILRGKEVTAALRAGPSDLPPESGKPVPLDHRVSEALTVGLPGWFNRRAPWMQNAIQGVLTVIVMFATGIVLGFSIQAKTDVAAGNQITNSGRLELGGISPWFTADFSSLNHSFAVHWFSASLWIGVVGAAAGCLSERLRRSRPGFDEVADRRKRRIWLVVAVVMAALYLIGLVVNVAIMSGTTGKAARAVMNSANDAVTYFDGHTSQVKALGVSPDGRTLISAGMDGRVIIRDLPGGKLRRIALNSPHPTSEPPNKFRSLLMSPNSATALIGGDLRGYFYNFDLLNNVKPGEPLYAHLEVPNEAKATSAPLMFYDDGKKLAYLTGHDAEIVFYDTVEKRILAKAQINAGKSTYVGPITASPDGRFIAVTSAGMTPLPNDPTISQTTGPFKLSVFDTQGVERLTWQFADSPDWLNGQIVFPDARTFAVCLPSGRMQRWTLDAAGKWQLQAEPLRIAPGRYAASAASRDGKIIWLAENRRVEGIDSVTGKGVAVAEFKVGERRGEYGGEPIQALVATAEADTIAVSLWDGRVALAKCYRYESGAAPSPPANDAEPASSAVALLRQVSEKYGKLSAFSATGKIVSQVVLTNGAAPTTLTNTFSLNLARPEFYRLLCTNTIMAGVTIAGAAWSAGDGHKFLMNDKVSTFLNREQNQAVATGISGGAAHTVPTLFFKDNESSLSKTLPNAAFLPDETLGKELCHVIAADGPAGKYRLWISKKDLLLRQFQTAHIANSGKQNSQPAEDLSDESIKKILKMTGQESTPDMISKVRQMRTKAGNTAASSQITTTETYERIEVDGLMIKEDFEVTAPTIPAGSKKP